MKTSRIVRGILLPLALFALLVAAKKTPEPPVDLAQLDFREGDIVFQHLPGKLGSVISLEKQSDQ